MGDSDDELGTPPTPPRLTRGVPHIPDLDEPPSPPRLVRSQGRGFNGRDELFESTPVHLNRQFPGLSLASPSEFSGRMRRGPSQPVDGYDWIREFTSNASPVSPRSSGTWSVSTEEEDIPTWWFEMPERFRSDVFWNHMFRQPHFFLLRKKIRPEKKELIDRIMDLLPIKDKSMFDARSRTHTLKNPFPNVVNVAFVKQFLMNLTPLSLTPEDRYRFEMMIMNFFMFAPMSALEGYIRRFSIHGGKTKKRRKHKTKRV